MAAVSPTAQARAGDLPGPPAKVFHSFGALAAIRGHRAQCELCKSDRLSPGAQMMLVVLALRANDGGLAWPGEKTLQADLDVERRTVERRLAELRRHGLVQKVQEGSRRRAATWAMRFDPETSETFYRKPATHGVASSGAVVAEPATTDGARSNSESSEPEHATTLSENMRHARPERATTYAQNVRHTLSQPSLNRNILEAQNGETSSAQPAVDNATRDPDQDQDAFVQGPPAQADPAITDAFREGWRESDFGAVTPMHERTFERLAARYRNVPTATVRDAFAEVAGRGVRKMSEVVRILDRQALEVAAR